MGVLALVVYLFREPSGHHVIDCREPTKRLYDGLSATLFDSVGRLSPICRKLKCCSHLGLIPSVL